jgi:hypothetical protein
MSPLLTSLTNVMIGGGRDLVSPRVVDVSATNANGTYTDADTIHITVQFSEVVLVTGTPVLLLETGISDHQASYASGSGTNTLVFDYTPTPGDFAPDLDYRTTGSLTLNGGTIKDAAGNNATLTLASPGASGSLGANKNISIDAYADLYSVDFGSANNSKYLSVPASAAFALGSACTVSAWIKFLATSPNFEIVASFNPVDPYTGFTFQLYNRRLVLFTSNGVGSYVEADGDGAQMMTGDWHHVVATVSGTTCTFYVDGVQHGNTKTVESIGNSGTELRIGLDTNSSPSRYFQGKIDEISIWNVGMNLSQVGGLYGGGTPPDLAKHSLVANGVSWWQMGDRDDSTSTIKDRFGTHHATTHGFGGSEISTDVPPDAREFNGRTSKYQAASSSVFDVERTDSITILAWIKPAAGNNISGHGFTIVSKVEDLPRERGLHFFTDTDGTLGFQLLNDQTVYATSNQIEVYATGSINIGSWNKVAATYNGSSAAAGALLYVNDVSVKNRTDKDTLTGTIRNSIKFEIGNDTQSSYGAEAKGLIYEVRIFNRVLSQVEIAAETIASSPASGKTHRWLTDNATTIADLVGSDNLTGTDITVNSEIPS